MNKNIDNLLVDYCNDIGIENINWFNFNEVLNELMTRYNLTDRDSNKLEKQFDSLFVKMWKDLKKDINSIKDVNIVAEFILNEIIEVYGANISKNELENLTYPIDSVSKNHVTKSLNYFEAHKLIKRDPEGKPVFYRLTPNHWFEQSRYVISDLDVVKTITPIIVSYIKNGGVHDYNIQKLFEKISEVIEYVIKPSLYHNEKYELEEEIIDLIDNNNQEGAFIQSIDIYDSQRKNEFTIIPIRIKFEHNKKYVVANIVDEDDRLISKNEEFALEHIDYVDSHTTNYSSQVRQPLNSMLSYKTFTSYKTESVENSIYKEIDVILECDTVVYEYFQIKPLKEMKTFATEDELIEFHTNFKDYKPKKNKFYITAKDTEEMIISTVLHCLPHAVILENDYLNEKLIQKFKGYAKGVNIEICPPLSPIKPNSDSKNDTKKSDITHTPMKPKKELSKEQLDEENKKMSDLNKDIDKFI